MTNSVDPDQTVPVGAVSSGSTLFAPVFTYVNNVTQLFAADHLSRRHFQMHFCQCFKGKDMYSCISSLILSIFCRKLESLTSTIR